jgi:hypothetical protein
MVKRRLAITVIPGAGWRAADVGTVAPRVPPVGLEPTLEPF